ncbi:hypothetical protein M8C21_028801 [Ambrosia artemisiifolia]|uniref:non-specific serine/threonine protein kinase n=1 Tax=Ambrosia artemisiifolia TaxID=4212 RepID=A0AAD5GEM5_AMBAR|nr:hypothetical protein M8C21_028801 [Ambrosia artemisiifolia]
MITRDPYETLTSWNTSFHFCDWSGVSCGRRHRRVTVINLMSQGLTGSLSPHVENLTFLRELWLSNNSFEGPIPHELGRLSRLRFLYLDQNKLSGVIPTNLSGCSSLEELQLGNNNFLSKLTLFAVDDNNLTGGIPPFLGNITSMKLLSVALNPLGGNIPDTLGNLKSLTEFYSAGCNVSGTIPNSIYNNSLLTVLSMSDNQLSSSLPSDIGALLPRLVILQLRNNQLVGLLPRSISNCSKLKSLEMDYNNFSGKLEIDFSKLRDIKRILLQHNLFGHGEADEMKFIDSLTNCSSLQYLGLGNCRFKGELPESVGNLSNQLQTLNLGANQLYGNLPSSVGNLVGLIALSLVENEFTGIIPTTIGMLQNLQAAFLYENQFSGPIPDAFGNLTKLVILSLRANKLEGDIPPCLGNFHQLQKLELSNNKLSGKIPKSVLQLPSLSVLLNLSRNNLFGSLPNEVGSLKMLSNIPSSLGGCVSLSFLSLKSNLFQGMIPPSFSSLRGVIKLDLSHNNLTGQVPRFFEWFSLQYIDLSFNDFEGETPLLGVFKNSSAFSVLGNSRLCGGLKKNKRQPSQSSTSEHFLKVSYNQLLKGTDGFSETNLIGKGGLSYVYKGILDVGDDKYETQPSSKNKYSHQNNSTGTVGTIGYAPPEYGLGSEMTSSGDIYSFGILLLEVMTGKKPTDDIFIEGLSLHKFASMALHNGVSNVIDGDAILMQSSEANVEDIEECLASIVKIGVSCSMDFPPLRLKIKIVVHELKHILNVLQNI